MEVKGTAIKSIKAFVQEKHKHSYQEWLESLSLKAKEIFQSEVLATQWYPIKDAFIEPTIKISELFYSTLKEGAWECGRFSAQTGLNGVYKAFVKNKNPRHIIDRARKLISIYYTEAHLEVHNSTGRSVCFHIHRFPVAHKVVDYRIGGWIERSFELSGCKNVNVEIEKSIAEGDEFTVYKINWN